MSSRRSCRISSLLGALNSLGTPSATPSSMSIVCAHCPRVRTPCATPCALFDPWFVRIYDNIPLVGCHISYAYGRYFASAEDLACSAIVLFEYGFSLLFVFCEQAPSAWRASRRPFFVCVARVSVGDRDTNVLCSYESPIKFSAHLFGYDESGSRFFLVLGNDLAYFSHQRIERKFRFCDEFVSRDRRVHLDCRRVYLYMVYTP